VKKKKHKWNSSTEWNSLTPKCWTILMAEEGTKDDFLFLRREFDDFFSLLLNQ